MFHYFSVFVYLYSFLSVVDKVLSTVPEHMIHTVYKLTRQEMFGHMHI
jgi:hypothetical protein